MDKGEVGSGSRYDGKRCCLAPVPGAAAPVGVVIVVKRNTLENCYKVKKREREKITNNRSLYSMNSWVFLYLVGWEMATVHSPPTTSRKKHRAVGQLPWIPVKV